jgi:hypothetical protein
MHQHRMEKGVEPMQCPDCGAVVTSEDMFCGECGRPLPGKMPASRPVTPAEVKDRVTETVSLSPASSPARKKTPGRTSIFIVAGIGALVLCVCAFVALSVLVFRSQPTPAPVVVVEVTATPGSGALLFADDFADPGSGWDVFAEDDTAADYADGEYRVGVYRDNYVAWGNPQDQQFDNFAVEVDARTVEGPLDNNFGILVRYQADGDNFYWFEISSDGYYSVDMMQAGEWVGLVDWVESDAINQGIGATNHLRVVCDRDQFSFYANGTYLVDVSDAAFG